MAPASQPFRTALRTALLLAALAPLSLVAHAADTPLVDALHADYPITKVGIVLLKFDYNRITQPGCILVVRIPGIYADVAGTTQAIVKTNIEDGKAIQQKGFLASLSKTGQSKTLAPGDKVYVTRLDVKHDLVHFELLTEDVTTLAGGEGTRYRSELNFPVPNLDSMQPDAVKKLIDAVIADPATANAVESKTIKLGMSPDEVKSALGNPDKIVDLGAKQIFVYKDMKVVFNDAKVSDVQ